MEADFQILVSIYNPNVLNAEIETGSALLYHGDTEVRARNVLGAGCFRVEMKENEYKIQFNL